MWLPYNENFQKCGPRSLGHPGKCTMENKQKANKMDRMKKCWEIPEYPFNVCVNTSTADEASTYLCSTKIRK